MHVVGGQMDFEALLHWEDRTYIDQVVPSYHTQPLWQRDTQVEEHSQEEEEPHDSRSLQAEGKMVHGCRSERVA